MLRKVLYYRSFDALIGREEGCDTNSSATRWWLFPDDGIRLVNPQMSLSLLLGVIIHNFSFWHWLHLWCSSRSTENANHVFHYLLFFCVYQRWRHMSDVIFCVYFVVTNIHMIASNIPFDVCTKHENPNHIDLFSTQSFHFCGTHVVIEIISFSILDLKNAFHGACYESVHIIYLL